MILNSGLDAACASPATNTALSFASWVNYAAFGTGSIAPAATDTSLAAQVGSRSNSNGGFADSEDAALDAVNNVMWHEATFTRVFTISTNVNAAEWGLSPIASGNLSVRELFRADPTDNSSQPITLTLQLGDQLQLVLTLRVEAAWDRQSKSFVITGTAGNDTNGTHTGLATVSSGAGTTTADIRANALAYVWPGGISGSSFVVRAWDSDQSAVAKNAGFAGNGTASSNGSAAAYTPGNYYVDWTAVFSTAQANMDHYAWATATLGRGLRFALTSPGYLTKNSTHKLTLTVRKSISRL